MSYTVWSKGRLVGNTDLGFQSFDDGSRAGNFFPTPLGETLMPVVTGVPPATQELVETRRHARARRSSNGRHEQTVDADPDIATARANLAAAQDQLAALELELRGPDGAVIPTKWIGIQDTEYLLARADRDEERFECDEFLFPPDDDLLASIEADRAVISAWERGRDPDDPDDADIGFDLTDVADELEEPEFPRYQIFLELAGA